MSASIRFIPGHICYDLENIGINKFYFLFTTEIQRNFYTWDLAAS